MNIKELRKTVRTYHDHELKTMAMIAKWTEAKTKESIIRNELARREEARKQGTYEDETLEPNVPIRERLKNL